MLCTSDTALKKILYILVTLNLILTPLYSQPSITWQRMYDGQYHNFDYGWDICKSNENGSFIFGTTTIIGGFFNYIIKINSYGDTLWTKVLDSHGGETITSSGDEGCIFTGFLYPDSGLYFIKLNSAGNEVWTKYYGGNFAQCNKMIKTIDNGYIACGRSTLYKGCILKIDSNGGLIWEREFPGGANKEYKSVSQSNDGGYVAAGILLDSITYTHKAVITKIDEAGEIDWEKTFKISNLNGGIVEIEKIPNGYFISGTVNDTSVNPSVTTLAFFSRTDNAGNLLFTKIFPSDKTEICLDAKVVNNNRYVFALYGLYYGWLDTSYAEMLLTDSTGNTLARKTIISRDEVLFESILPLSNGDLIFLGTADFLQFGGYNDIYAVRTDSMLNFPPNIIGVKYASNEIPKEFNLHQNYPNPFNPATKIKFAIPTPLSPPFTKGGWTKSGGFVTLKIYDILGREIATLINQQLKAGVYEAEWNATNYPSGVYFYHLTVEEYTECKKMVLIK